MGLVPVNTRQLSLSAASAKYVLAAFAALLSMAMGLSNASAEGVAAKPFPTAGNYAGDVIFPSHVSREDMNAAVQRHFEVWKKAYVRDAGGQGAWIKYDNTESGVSEGQGYGMVISAYMADQSLFDALMQFYLNHPSSAGTNLMAWKQTLQDGKMVDVEGPDSATDGDLDIAYGLLLADIQWGSTPEKDYKGQALKVLHDILAMDVNSAFWNLTPGDWAHGDDAERTRPSDFMTGQLITFAKADPENADEWNAILARINRTVNQTALSKANATGLMPDFMYQVDGTFKPVVGAYLETEYDGDYYYNACRTPWRLAMSYISFGQPDLLESQRKTTAWAKAKAGGEPTNFVAGYRISTGEAFSKETDLPFVAPLAVGAMLGGAENQEWLNTLWDSITGKDFPEQDYYFGDSIRLQVLITVSGNWWTP